MDPQHPPARPRAYGPVPSPACMPNRLGMHSTPWGAVAGASGAPGARYRVVVLNPKCSAPTRGMPPCRPGPGRAANPARACAPPATADALPEKASTAWLHAGVAAGGLTLYGACARCLAAMPATARPARNSGANTPPKLVRAMPHAPFPLQVPKAARSCRCGGCCPWPCRCAHCTLGMQGHTRLPACD